MDRLVTIHNTGLWHHTETAIWLSRVPKAMCPSYCPKQPIMTKLSEEQPCSLQEPCTAPLKLHSPQDW